jgi:putative RecB family exonuclease
VSNETGSLPVPAYLSPSSIETFRQCPLKYKLSRIDKLPDPPTEATIMGNFVHSVLEDLLAVPAAERTIPTARLLMANQWHTAYSDRVSEILMHSEKAIHKFRWNSWWCIENYFKIEDPSAIDSKGIEHELNGFIEDVPLKGFIDRWHEEEAGICISDYKTGKTPKPRYANNKFFAMTVYADLLSKETEKPVSKIELLYLKDGVRMDKPITNGLLSDMREIVTTTYREVKVRCSTGEFEPTRNTLCDWCNYKPICPVWETNYRK